MLGLHVRDVCAQYGNSGGRPAAPLPGNKAFHWLCQTDRPACLALSGVWQVGRERQARRLRHPNISPMTSLFGLKTGTKGSFSFYYPRKIT
jgi:hypothetical protein